MSCAGCGPLGERVDYGRSIAEHLIQGHRLLATHYEQLAKDMVIKDDQAAVEALTKFHREVADEVEKHLPVLEPDPVTAGASDV